MSADWHDYPFTGFPFLDGENREIGVMFDRFVETVDDGDRAEIVRFMELFLEALAAHFGHEEELMLDIGDVQLGRHREAHELCLSDADRHLDDLRHSGVTREFRQWATAQFPEWFRLHVAMNDVGLGRKLAARARAQASQHGDPDLDVGLTSLGL